MNKTTDEIRDAFLSFFKQKGHVIIPSSSLVPNNDPTLLFTNAGMNQFKDIFLGKKQSCHSRVVTSQHCLRTGGKHNDIENVGYTTRHHTFFEMLGNFSFNDYFKKEAIIYAWELLTSPQWFNIPKNKLWISVYTDDKESYDIWSKVIKISPNHIFKIGDINHVKYNSDNFWQMGDTGPCGFCTEIFYDCQENDIHDNDNILENKKKYLIEIWNIVFIEFNRISEKNLIPLPTKSIDTGMGLERITSILQNVFSNYKTDIFKKLIKSISKFSPVKDLNHTSFKIIADHIRACVFIIADNIIPSNEHRGYILRRIIRRALRHGHKLGIKENFFYKLVPDVIKIMSAKNKILNSKEKIIKKTLQIEEIQFTQTLDKGLKLLKKEIKNTKNNVFNGEIAFYLYDTFGFPIDLTADICNEKKIKIDYEKYKKAKENQKKKSSSINKFYKNYNESIIVNYHDTCFFQGYDQNNIQTIVKKIFIHNTEVFEINPNQKGIIFLDKTSFYGESGGQVGDIGQLYNEKSMFQVENTKKYGNTIGHIGYLISGKIIVNDHICSKINQTYRNSIQLNHTAIHLLHAALRYYLGNDVFQKGSFVNDQYLRFDFSYSNHIHLSQLQNIEKIVNMKIRDNILIKIKHLSLEEAKKKKALALFDYYNKSSVRVVFINDFSIELCGGTHTTRTGDIGYFKIISYSSIASGIKRIEAVTAEQAINYLHEKENDIQDISIILKSNSTTVKDSIKKLINKVNILEKKNDHLQKKENKYLIKQIIQQIEYIQEVKIIIQTLNKYDRQILRKIIEQLHKEIKIGIIILINIKNNNFVVMSTVSKNLTHRIQANNIIKEILKKTNGKGGGNHEIAEGGGVNIKIIPLALKYIKLWIKTKLLNTKN
ncbi:alanine--tRNA ligase [Buchnera aphidicola]|uniref:alanine--tRNA ligase n=1 Tax=Buchnera aphidicola TaxID=9 RepID=UPI0034646004